MLSGRPTTAPIEVSVKYRVTDKMPKNAEGYKAGDVIEYPPDIAMLSIKRGYIEPLPMDEAKQDKMIRHSRRKES